ncbi:MAG: MBL fold metallo-hydrolase [Paenirhodobacter sp.]|uniref:MBL fold metallo-hydrolase n=1 Tax=Paenirhodobacter sp. TaxID=1965326 RepID=UPI003D0B6469
MTEPQTKPHLSRRATLLAVAGTLAAPALTGQAAAQTTPEPPLKDVPAIAPWRRLTLGTFTVTPLLAGTRVMDHPHDTFGTDASADDFEALSTARFLPTDKSLNFFTPVLVETGSDVVLFDTGLAPDGIRAALAAAGKAPEDVTLVVLTHMHADHIGGLSDGTGLTFPQAKYATGQMEFDYWAKSGNEVFEAKIRPLADQLRFLTDGETVVSGVTAILAPGHTPGHMAFEIENGGRKLILTADTANHYVWSLERPDWKVRFDIDPAQAAATRHRLLGRIAAERLPFIGYHMPFPGVGFLEPTDQGFRFVPASYQFDL